MAATEPPAGHAFALIAGTNDYPHFAAGWHERQTDGRCGVRYRAANGTGHVVLRRHRGAASVCALLSGARGLRDTPLAGTVVVDGEVYEVALDADLWVLRRFPLRKGTGETVSLLFDMPGAPCPDEVLGNGDGRRLGWFVAAVWQEEAAGD